jgi:hypothetical protein
MERLLDHTFHSSPVISPAQHPVAAPHGTGQDRREHAVQHRGAALFEQVCSWFSCFCHVDRRA